MLLNQCNGLIDESTVPKGEVGPKLELVTGLEPDDAPDPTVGPDVEVEIGDPDDIESDPEDDVGDPPEIVTLPPNWLVSVSIDTVWLLTEEAAFCCAAA